MGNPTDELRARLDELGIDWWPDKYYRDTNTCWRVGDFEWHASEKKDGKLLIGCTCVKYLTPKQAITATVGPTLDQDLQQALDFMRIWISEDAHLGESTISYELERAEGLRNLDAIEQAIAATVGAGTCKLVIEKRPRHGPWIYHYSCGYDFWQPAGCPMPVLKHCPNCGKRIAKED